MIKKKLAILLLSVSSLFLLAHGAIPHHHHGSAVCFNQSHCIPRHTDHDTGLAGHSHDDKAPESEDNCILNQVFITPASQVKTEISQVSASGDFSGVIDSFSAVLAGGVHLPVIQSLEVGGQPPFRSHILRPDVSCLCLRAPPAV